MNLNHLSRRTVLRGTLGGAVLLGLSACGTRSGEPASSADNGTPVQGGNLRIGVVGGGAQDSLDPKNMQQPVDFARSAALYDPVAFSDVDYRRQFRLAESIEPADKSGTVWVVRLKPGVEFHNGKSLAAEDLIFTIQRGLDPKSPGLAATFLAAVNADQLKALDGRTVQIQLSSPSSIFPLQIGTVGVPVVPVGFDPQNPVGTGPFKFQSFAPGDRSVMVRNPNYWSDVAHVDQLEIINVADPSASLNGLQGGQFDAIPGIQFSQAELVKNAGARLVVSNDSTAMMFAMNMAEEPFKDVRVRQAIRLIVDREQVVQQALNGYGEIANDLYARFDPAYRTDLPQRKQDIAEAKSLLQSAGHSDLNFEIPATDGYSGSIESAQVFAEQAKAAGVNAHVAKYDSDTYYSRYYKQSLFGVDLAAPESYMTTALQYSVPGGEYNSSNQDDPEYTRILSAAFAEMDETKRNERLRELQQIDYDRGGYVIWGFTKSLDAASTKVGGLRENTKSIFGLNNYAFNKMWLT